MNDLERFRRCMEYEPTDRVPVWDWGAWPETVERWRREGFDPEREHPASVGDQRHWVAHLFFPNPPFERRVIEEDDEHVTFVNREGILMRENRKNPQSSMPQFIRFPAETPQDFRAFWKERMSPDLATRWGPRWREDLQTMRATPAPLLIVADRWGGFFGPLRNLVGVERLCTLFYDDPAFLEEMMDANAEFLMQMMGQILEVVPVDVFVLWEDMAYHHAPLISPEMARDLMLPRYRRVCEFVRGRGVPYVGLDSDGHIDPLIPIWMDAGINALYPFEVQARMDVCEVRKTYGRDLRIWGGYDKRALAMDRVAIDREFERLRPLVEEGGYILHTDHSCPPDVPYDNYCYYWDQALRAAERG